MFKNNDKLQKILNIIAIVFLVLAVTNNLYDYDILLWIVTLAAIFNIYLYYKKNVSELILAFAAIALLFNPILPIYLNHDIKTVIEVISAGILAYPLLK